jgi:hypothetical protein
MVQAGASPTVLPPAAGSVTVTLDKNQCAPFLFYPLTSTLPEETGEELPLRFFAPAGYIYPSGTNATWRDGFGTNLCLDLLSQTSPGQTAEQRRAFCNRFNWQRFSDEVEALEQAAADDISSINTPFNPWNLNRKKIITAVSAGKFTKTTLKGSVADKPVSVTVNLSSGTASPIYYQPYILAPAIIPADDPASLTLLYCVTPDNNILFDPNAGAVLLICPEASPSKNYRLAVLPLEHYTQG